MELSRGSDTESKIRFFAHVLKQKNKVVDTKKSASKTEASGHIMMEIEEESMVVDRR
jgi:hypothetical protein